MRRAWASLLGVGPIGPKSATVSDAAIIRFADRPFSFSRWCLCWLLHSTQHSTLTIAVLNQKGGSGKTTLCTNLARALQLEGYHVLIADADPQASALSWREASGREDMPTTVSVDRDSFDQDLAAVGVAFDYVLIDGAPRMDTRSRAAVRAADVVLLPVHPSAFDLWASQSLVAMIKERQDITGGRPQAAFVVSRAVTGTNLATEAGEALSSLGLPVFEALTSQRIAYAEAAGLGLSVLDYEPGGKAAGEIYAITNEILERYGQA